MPGIFYSSIDDITKADFTLLEHRGSKFSELTNSLGHFKCATSTDFNQIVANNTGMLMLDGFVFNSINELCDVNWLSQQFSNDFDHNIEIVRNLKGEFSITWITDEKVMFFSDYAGYRPLFFSYDEKHISLCNITNIIFELTGSYYKTKANSAYCWERRTGSINKKQIYYFDLTQNVNNWDTVFEKFENSIKCYYSNLKSVTLISSGYDSSVIACAVNKIFPDYNNFYYVYSEYENNQVMEQRSKIHDFETIYLAKDNWSKNTKPLYKDTYKIYKKLPNKFILQCRTVRDDMKNTFTDNQNIAAVYWELCKNYMDNEQFIMTGEGADDVFSDAGYKGIRLRPTDSQFGGLFPRDLEIEWPWVFPFASNRNLTFTGQQQKDVATPLSDKDLVQAFLNTTQDLKNSRYKAWLAQYMEDHNYPYDSIETKEVDLAEDMKIGFYTV